MSISIAMKMILILQWSALKYDGTVSIKHFKLNLGEFVFLIKIIIEMSAFLDYNFVHYFAKFLL